MWRFFAAATVSFDAEFVLFWSIAFSCADRLELKFCCVCLCPWEVLSEMDYFLLFLVVSCSSVLLRHCLLRVLLVHTLTTLWSSAKFARCPQVCPLWVAKLARFKRSSFYFYWKDFVNIDSFCPSFPSTYVQSVEL